MLGDAFGHLLNEFKCVNIINNLKALELSEKPNRTKPPNIFHAKQNKYLSLDKNGHPIIDVDYGKHAAFGPDPVLHVHKWKGKRITNVHRYSWKDHKKYGKYLKGLIKNEWIN